MIAPTAVGMPRSGIREVMDLASQTPGCIRLDVGEPSFPTPEHIVEAGVKALRDGLTKYAPNAGLPKLREEITHKVRSFNRFEAKVDQVVVTVGAVQGLYSSLLALTEPGDRVLLPDPGWPNYAMMAHLLHLGQDHYVLRREHDFVPNVADLERAVTPRTRAIMINSPSNPLGTIVPAENLLQISDFADRHDLYVISDEAYEGITYKPGFASIAAVGNPDRVISVFTFSKNYAMTGWRVGYVVAPDLLSPVLAKLQEPLVSCVNTPAQVAATAALTGPQDVVAQMADIYRRRRDALISLLTQHGIEHVRPNGAFYTWVSLGDRQQTARDLSRELLTERGVAIAPGTAFGPSGEGWVRLSLANDDELLLEGAERLIAFLHDERSASPSSRATAQQSGGVEASREAARLNT
jgi:aspartate aminotransferase